jgi:ATP-binding protein involved in chromosome partitioning
MPVPPEDTTSSHLLDALRAQLSTVIDPELRQDVVSLGMIGALDVDDAGAAHIRLDLTIAGCPKKADLTEAVREAALRAVPAVDVELGVMPREQREALTARLRGPERGIPFNEPGSLTRVIAVASGKGGVGKSTVTANLALALSAQGLTVAVVDADIHGFSMPDLLGVEGGPTKIDDLMLPPRAHEVAVMSIGMFVGSDQPITWRGPMLHRALEQFLKDTYFGAVDALLLDLPPGTGDIAISAAQLLPRSELLIVTTPQESAAAVAERAGAMGAQTGQKVIGVVENMSWLDAGGQRLTPFGEGGGQELADRLSTRLAETQPEGVSLLAQIPLRDDVRDLTRTGAFDPSFEELAGLLARRPRGLQGMNLLGGLS